MEEGTEPLGYKSRPLHEALNPSLQETPYLQVTFPSWMSENQLSERIYEDGGKTASIKEAMTAAHSFTNI